MNEEQFGKGALPHVEDTRDYRFAGAGVPFDWSKPYDVETLVGTMYPENQGGSFSCGGSWDYLSGVLEAIANGQPYQRKSRKFIYSQCFVSQGGSDGRVLSDLCVKKGACVENLCSSYNADGSPLTEEQYQRPDTITDAAFVDAAKNKELFYGTVEKDIDSVAQAIQVSGGVMLGVYGQNNGTWMSEDPIQPHSWVPQSEKWSHWVFAGKAGIRNGKKSICILNSWGRGAGKNGWQWLSEDYFKSGNVWVCWTMNYDKQSFIVPPAPVAPWYVKFQALLKLSNVKWDGKNWVYYR